MNKLSLEATDFTPHILFDHIEFRFELKGESSPEDAKQFYAPVIKWIDDFGKYLHFLYESQPTLNKRELIFHVHLDYVTSSSLKNIYDLLLRIETLKAYTKKLLIDWKYDEGDEDMRDNGEEFSKMLKMPFEISAA
jgi:hypothetical protein